MFIRKLQAHRRISRWASPKGTPNFHALPYALPWPIASVRYKLISLQRKLHADYVCRQIELRRALWSTGIAFLPLAAPPALLHARAPRRLCACLDRSALVAVHAIHQVALGHPADHSPILIHDR